MSQDKTSAKTEEGSESSDRRPERHDEGGDDNHETTERTGTEAGRVGEIAEEMEKRLGEMKGRLEEQARVMRRALNKTERETTKISKAKQRPSDDENAEKTLRQAKRAETKLKDHDGQRQANDETHTGLIRTREKANANPGCGRLHRETDGWRRNVENAEPCSIKIRRD